MASLELYVAPGSTGTGTKNDPLPNLQAALSAARSALTSGHDGDIAIYLREGVFRTSEPVGIGPEDTDDGRVRLRIAAAPGETPVLSGGTPLSGWRRVSADDPPDGLPTQAIEHVWATELPRREGEAASVKVLFDGDGMLDRAHSPRLQSVPEPQEPVAPPIPPGVDPEEFLDNHPVYRELHFAEGDMRSWPNLTDVELFLTPRNPWTVNFLPLESVNETTGVARTGLPSTYPLTTAYGPAHIKRFYRVENVLEYLDHPGTWVIANGTVYLWPRSDGEPANVEAPMTTELLRIEGDFEASRWASNIEIEGLTFTHTDRYSWRAGRRSVQHDWEEEDAPSAMLRVRGGERITVRNCRFVDTGGSGVRLDLHAVDVRVEACEIGHVGGTGVSFVGFGPGTRDENHHNAIVGNHIHHVGRLWWHAAGVFVAQSGHNVISDNVIHHTPYCAMVLSGPRASVFSVEAPRLREGALTIRWDELADAPIEQPVLLGFRHARYNHVVHNEIHDAMELLGDGNGIYVSGTGVGNLVARNYVHDINGQGTVSGIRLDDEEFHASVEENVVFRICGAGILTKNINQIENNIIADCYGPRQYGYLSARHRGPCFGTGIRRNILLRLPRPGAQKEPFWKLDDAIGFLPQVSIDDNLLWDAEDPPSAQAALDAMRGIGKGARTVVADPRFADAEGGDFRLTGGSPAHQLGFRPIYSWGPRGR